jgi:hypothetical protein
MSEWVAILGALVIGLGIGGYIGFVEGYNHGFAKAMKHEVLEAIRRRWG